MTTSPLSVNSTRDTVQPANSDELSALYDRDYFSWIETTLQRLQQKDYGRVDWDNLIEEIADRGRSEKRRLRSNLRVVLMHLLKWQYQPERRSGSWNASIIEHRIRVRDNLEESPSLRPLIEKARSDVYRDAVKIAAAETQLPIETFPTDCPYAIAQILDDEFLPE